MLRSGSEADTAAATILAPSWVLPNADGNTLESGSGVLIVDGRVDRVAPLVRLTELAPDARRIDLPGCLLMAGWINAHQHGRGLSQIQLGYHDTFLETWIASRRGKGLLDPYPITKLAALEMLAHGVTCAIHANYSYGTGDYEAEVREQLRAYDEAGLRVTMCIGLQDRGALSYPPHEACFVAGLSDSLRDWVTRAGPKAYAGNAEETIALMHRLRRDYAANERVRFCYGPAGPQWVSDSAWQALAADAARHDIGLHTHAMESPAQLSAARELFPDGVFQHLDRLGVLGPRTVLAHGVWVEEADMALLAERGVTVVRNPGCNLRMRNGIAPLARYLAHGVRVAIGSDNVTLNDDEDLLGELRLADQLAREPDWSGAEPAGVDQLLEMLTVNGAHAAQWSDEVGALRPGAAADLVAISLQRVSEPMLDADMPLLRAMLARSKGTDVRLTMVAGEVLYREGVHSRCSREEAQQQAVAAALSARATVDAPRRAMTDELVATLTQHYRKSQ